MKRFRTPGRQAGFTLVESMIAMFFMAFIIVEMGNVFVYASRNANLSKNLTRANALAEEAIEKSRNTAYNNLQLANAALGEAGGASASHTSTLDNGRFTRVRTVSPQKIDYSTNPATVTSVALTASNQSTVDVTVTFTDARGNSQVSRVSTVLSRY